MALTSVVMFMMFVMEFAVRYEIFIINLNWEIKRIFN